MYEYISEFKVPVHDLMLDKGLETRQDLTEILDDFLFFYSLVLLDLSKHVASIAVLED